MKTVLRVLTPALLIAAGTLSAHAELTRIEIKSTKDVLGGKAWGNTGAYEELIGTAYFTIDPKAAANRNIPNIDKAPKDAKGLIEFSSDIYIDRPKDAAKGNGVAFFEASNRGRRSLSTTFSQPFRAKQPEEEAQYGDGTLFKEGFTLVWVGWQNSVDRKPGLVGIDLPIAMENGKPVTGKVNTFGIGAPWIILKDSPTLTLDPDTRRYTPVSLNDPKDVLQVAQGGFDKPTVIPRDQWRSRMSKTASPRSLTLKTGFKAGMRYDLIYTAKNTPVLGLGYTAQRDVASAFRYRSDQPVTAKYEYFYGASQTGRFLREYIYDGFVADEQGRKTFDAIWPQISGSARGDFINPFSLQDGLGIFTGSMFPYLGCAAEGSGHRQDRRHGNAHARLGRAQDHLYQHRCGKYRRRPRRRAALYRAGRQDRTEAARQCARLYVGRRPAWTGGIPAGQRRARQSAQSQQLHLGHARHLCGHGRLGAQGRRAARQPISQT